MPRKTRKQKSQVDRHKNLVSYSVKVTEKSPKIEAKSKIVSENIPNTDIYSTKDHTIATVFRHDLTKSLSITGLLICIELFIFYLQVYRGIEISSYIHF